MTSQLRCSRHRSDRSHRFCSAPLRRLGFPRNYSLTQERAPATMGFFDIGAYAFDAVAPARQSDRASESAHDETCGGERFSEATRDHSAFSPAPSFCGADTRIREMAGSWRRLQHGGVGTWGPSPTVGECRPVKPACSFSSLNVWPRTLLRRHAALPVRSRVVRSQPPILLMSVLNVTRTDGRLGRCCRACPP